MRKTARLLTRILQIGAATLMFIVLVFWAHSHVRYDLLSMPLGEMTELSVTSSYGVIRVNLSSDSQHKPIWGIEAADPDLYDQAALSAHSVGIPMQTLREGPSFAWKRYSYVDHVREDAMVEGWRLSFPHWLLVCILFIPNAWWVFSKIKPRTIAHAI